MNCLFLKRDRCYPSLLLWTTSVFRLKTVLDVSGMFCFDKNKNARLYLHHQRAAFKGHLDTSVYRFMLPWDDLHVSDYVGKYHIFWLFGNVMYTKSTFLEVDLKIECQNLTIDTNVID